jgi:hypothetical protein
VIGLEWRKAGGYESWMHFYDHDGYWYYTQTTLLIHLWFFAGVEDVFGFTEDNGLNS